MLYRCREDDQCIRPAVLLELANKLIKLRGALEQYLQKHRIISGHTIALHNILTLLNIWIKLLLILRYHLKIDKRFDVISHHLRIDLRMKPFNISFIYQSLDPADTAGEDKYTFAAISLSGILAFA